MPIVEMFWLTAPPAASSSSVTVVWLAFVRPSGGLFLLSFSLASFRIFFSGNVDSEEEIVVLGNTVWVSGASCLHLEMPSVTPPYLRIISNAACHLRWIEIGLPFDRCSNIVEVFLFYQRPYAGIFISQMRLADYLLPTSVTVKHDNGTGLTNS